MAGLSSNAAAAPVAPKLRADLRFHARPGDDPHVVVEDQERGRFYRVGPAEYILLCEFDGRTPINVALERARQIQPDIVLSLPQAAELAGWLVATQLASRPDADDSRQLMQLVQKEGAAGARAWTSLFYLRVPLLAPDRLLSALVPVIGWLFSPLATLLAIAMAAWSLLPLVARWREVIGDLEDLYTPHRQLTLLIVWIVLKVLHELGHGIACKLYGGHVREAGVTFILFAPTAYIDVTSAWRFASPWRRIHVSAAGMYVEVLFAALAALIWQSTSSEVLRQLAADVILAGTISTVLFNLNPLMRFDGYYILSDLLGLQNLYESGRSYVRYWAKRYLLGMAVAAPLLRPKRASFVRVFGFASLIWYSVVTAGALAGLAVVFHGAGLVLAMVGAAWWYVVPAVRLVKWLFLGPAADRPNPVRAAFALTSGLALVIVILTCAPVSLPATAPAIVEYAPPTVLRTRTPGFVEEIHVTEGQEVSAGQLLFVLRNDELRVELAGLESQLARTEIRAAALRQRLPQSPQDRVAYQALITDIAALSKRVDETRRRNADLEIRATQSGRLVRRRLERLQGEYLHVGDEVVCIGSEDRKQLFVSLAQDDVELIAGDAQVTAYVPGVGSWPAALDRLDPRATVEPEHEALCAPYGGEIAAERSSGEWRFAAPRFTGAISLDSEEALKLRVGQRGTVSFGHNNESVGTMIFRGTMRIWQQAIHSK
jgi:putative peptide zinc metalloprotease protein